MTKKYDGPNDPAAFEAMLDYVKNMSPAELQAQMDEIMSAAYGPNNWEVSENTKLELPPDRFKHSRSAKSKSAAAA